MNILLAGASSAIAQTTAIELNSNGHQVKLISTKEINLSTLESYLVNSYSDDNLPTIDEPIDGLVYFPGTINLKPFNRISKEEFYQDFEVNVWGAINVVQKYLPLLKKSSSASVVFISSVAAQTGMTFHSSIAIAKAGLEGLTRSLAAEFAPTIRFNCIAPSLVNTPLSEKFINTPEKTEAIKNKNPLKKIGSPEEIAEAIMFLLSNQSSWITGQVLAVDGGMGVIK
jgi:NAD(P)-dependent dehydrogenase (short-subunit alcohol dehydrogenase family)